MRVNNFDGIAFIYDSLSQIFFGKSLKNAQTYFFNKIPKDSKVLVLGSGTGWIAEELLNNDSNLKITLVDASEKMTSIASKRLKGKAVEIFHADESKTFSNSFDVVILPCFLDLFQDKKLYGVFDSIKINLKPHSIWIVTDFVSQKIWHRVYLWIMYRFFSWTCNIESDRLPDWQTILSIKGLEVLLEKNFYKGFIKTILYRRNFQ